MSQDPEHPPGPWGPGAFRSGPLDAGASLVDDGGGDRSTELYDHPFRTADDERYGEGPVLGWGGMGQVLAVTDRRLNREVAYKRVTLRPGSRGSSVRLAREAWITAHLEHPGIVPVYDAGISEDGHLFYTMRLVRGRTLAEALRESPSLQARTSLLRHVLDACEAVAYAHSTGVVHRDLKPANVMVGSFGETQVVDWGLATVPDPSARAAWRALGLPGGPGDDDALAGTPAYMSPEQARGEPVDARTDVWSLGAIIYEVLTGGPPHQGLDSGQVLDRARQGAVIPVRRRQPDAQPELAAIAERALSADPADRYADAAQLARELARWFEGRQVHAYTYTPVDLLRRFVVAWRAPLLVAAAAAIALGALGTWSWSRTVAERNRAREAEASALEALSRADDALSRALVERAWVHAEVGSRPEAEVLAVRSLALRDSPEARGVLAAFAAQPRVEKVSEVLLPSCAQTQVDIIGSTLACIDPDRVSLWDLPASGEAERRWEVHLPGVASMLLQPDAPVLAASSDNTVHFLDAETGEVLATHSDQRTGIMQFQLEPGGSVPVGGRDDRLMAVDLAAMRVWSRTNMCGVDDILTGASRRPSGRVAAMCRNSALLVFDGDLEAEPQRFPTEFRGHHTASAIAFMPDGQRMVVGSIRGGVGLIDVNNGEQSEMAHSDGGAVRGVAPSPDGRWVAVVSERTGVQLWAPATGTFVGRLPATTRVGARWTPDGHLLTWSRERMERWRIPEQAGPVVYDSGVGLAAAAPSPDGSWLAIARGDHSIEVREVDTGAQVALHGVEDNPKGVCKRVAWSPTGSAVYGACMGERQTRTLRASDWSSQPGIPIGMSRRVLVLRPDLLVALTYASGGPVLARLDTGEILPAIAEGYFDDGSESPDRTLAALLDTDGGVHLLRSGERPTRTRVLTDPLARGVATDDTGDHIAVLHDHEVLVLAPDGEVLHRIPHEEAEPTDVLLDGSGERLFTAAKDGVARVWSLRTGALLGRLQGHSERIATIALSDDGETLWTASWDGTVRRWGLAALERPVEALVDDIRDAWDLDLDEALSP